MEQSYENTEDLKWSPPPIYISVREMIIMFTKIAATLMVIITVSTFCACSNNTKENNTISNTSPSTSPVVANDEGGFEAERKNFTTKLLYQVPAPQDYEEEIPPQGVSEVYYQSGNLQLKAWVSDTPSDGIKHPAMVYIHGGFAFGSADWDDTKAYIDAGFVVMAPMFRGENGNPGYFEMFYGEVDDAISAGEYLKALPFVDPERIYLFGHSTGGTIAMLVSMMPSPYKAIATSGASPDQKLFFNSWGDYAPFDLENPIETDMRNPMYGYQSMRTPLYVYVGRKDFAYYSSSEDLVNQAKHIGKICEFIPVEGDHFGSLASSIEDSIKRFN